MQIMVRSTVFLYNLSLKRLAIGPLFEQTSIPFTQGSFLQNLVEVNPKVLEKKNYWNVFLVCYLYLSLWTLWKSVWSLVEQTLILFTRRFSTQRLIGTDLMAMDVVLKVNIFLCAYRTAQCLFTIAFRVIEFLIIDDNLFIWHFIWRKVLTYC